jgi:hypothetical protein
MHNGRVSSQLTEPENSNYMPNFPTLQTADDLAPSWQITSMCGNQQRYQRDQSCHQVAAILF